MWTHGHFYWNELMTHDVEKAKAFYRDTVGWAFDPMTTPDGTYWVARMGDKPVGGLFTDVARGRMVTVDGGSLDGGGPTNEFAESSFWSTPTFPAASRRTRSGDSGR